MELDRLTLQAFSEELASDSPAPGGGSIAALCGGLAAALCAMVARLTVGKERYRNNWDAMTAVQQQADPLYRRFLHLMNRDAEAYNTVTAAFRLPRQSESQQADRRQAIQEAMKGAALVPLETLEAASALVEMAQEALAQGNPNAATDAGTALQLVRTCAAAAAYNVLINLGSIKDEAFVADCKARAEAIRTRIETIVADADESLHRRLR